MENIAHQVGEVHDTDIQSRTVVAHAAQKVTPLLNDLKRRPPIERRRRRGGRRRPRRRHRRRQHVERGRHEDQPDRQRQQDAYRECEVHLPTALAEFTPLGMIF